MKNFTYTPLNADLILGALPVQSSAPTVQVRTPAHYFFVIDKSGSMYSTLPRLIEDLKIQARSLKTGDALTFAWFSSRRESGFPIKAFRIVDNSSFVELDRLFDAHKEAMNLTCFSETLREVGRVLDETAFLNAKTIFTFFSDGWANDESVKSEQAQCREILKNLNGRFDLALTVAYSDYADREFLSEMAAIVGGVSVPSADLRQVSDALSQLIRRSESSVPRVRISLGDLKPEFVFSVDRNPETGGITAYAPDEKNEIYFAPNKNYPLDYLYFLARNDRSFANSDYSDGEEFNLQFELKQLGESFSDDGVNGLLSAAYASAVILSQNSKQDEAIDALGFIGDERLVNLLGTAYTPTERSLSEARITTAVLDPSKRWTGGKRFDCVPKPDAFCLLDLLNLLTEDSAARFHPRHPDFKYKKIGRSGKQREGYPLFVANPGASSPVSDFAWNKELLNLSIRTRIAGTVELPERITVNAEGKFAPDGTTVLTRPATLPEIYETFQWRNYALVRDGFLNVPSFPVSCSPDTALALYSKGAWQPLGEGFIGDNPVCVLQLDKIPVINKLIADKNPSASDLAHKTWLDEGFGAELKVLKALRVELDPKKEVVSVNNWTLDERRFLTALGFSDDNSYSPPTDKEPATDSYEATEFKIAVKGFSSLPKLDEVRARLKDNKLLTAAMLPMSVALSNFNANTANFSLPEKIRWIDDAIAQTKRIQAQNRNEIQKAKFAMILGHRWFSDIAPTSEVIEVPVGDLTASIKIAKKAIAI